ncbi:hypothetical protein [Salegentibacter maritimus]|uniref:hypothetical protein n=1 Tax=Salegentibacter maritimus TaxID=2794347 RepID=UPI0018E45535|nr:hypothetical protein [Salegentibacter maritimus]MBI6115999.1 hypothetical protein [Salegentibacter maritimus]
MSTSSIHPHRKLYLREIEEAFENLKTLEKDGFYNVPKITWWVLKYEELYEYAQAHRHVGSCIDGMGCSCCEKVPESRFSGLYPKLQEITELHQHEKYFREELADLENLRHDHPALMQWLKKNEKLGTEDFLMFWIEEWYDEENQSVTPYLFRQDQIFKFRASEWQHTIRFLEEFNELYWTSDACPKY